MRGGKVQKSILKFAATSENTENMQNHLFLPNGSNRRPENATGTSKWVPNMSQGCANTFPNFFEKFFFGAQNLRILKLENLAKNL